MRSRVITTRYYTMRGTMAMEGTTQLAPSSNVQAGTVASAPDLPRIDRIRTAVIIFNPTAGRRRHLRMEHLQEAQRVLKQAGVDAELAPTHGPGSATEQARTAAAHNIDLVIASGGDGTINEVVNGLAHSRVPLFILPAGTANVLAKELNLPWDVREAARFLTGSTLRRIALGAAVSDQDPQALRYFISLAGAGTDGMMVYSVNPALKRLSGQLAYWATGAVLPFRYRFPYLQVRSDESDAQGSLVVIGRTRHYGGPAMITSEADLFEDSFEIGVFEVGFWGGMRLLPAVMRGTLHGKRGVRFWKTQRVRCEPLSSEPIYAQVDGEGIGRLPVEFRIVPNALTLVVPGGR